MPSEPRAVPLLARPNCQRPSIPGPRRGEGQHPLFSLLFQMSLSQQQAARSVACLGCKGMCSGFEPHSWRYVIFVGGTPLPSLLGCPFWEPRWFSAGIAQGAWVTRRERSPAVPIQEQGTALGPVGGIDVTDSTTPSFLLVGLGLSVALRTSNPGPGYPHGCRRAHGIQMGLQRFFSFPFTKDSDNTG